MKIYNDIHNEDANLIVLVSSEPGFSMSLIATAFSDLCPHEEVEIGWGRFPFFRRQVVSRMRRHVYVYNYERAATLGITAPLEAPETIGGQTC